MQKSNLISRVWNRFLRFPQKVEEKERYTENVLTAIGDIANRISKFEAEISAFTDNYYRQFQEHQQVLSYAPSTLSTILRASGHYQESVNPLRVSLAVNPNILDGYRYLFETHLVLRQFSPAFEAFLLALDLEPVPWDPRITPARGIPGLDRVAAALEDGTTVASRNVTLFTSVMSKRPEIQRLAIESWRRAGLRVVSLNTPDEIDHVAPLFSDIEFISVDPSWLYEENPNLLPIDDILSVMAREGSTVCGFINSDIIMMEGGNLLASVTRHVHGSLVFGSRLDIQNFNDDVGTPYSQGFDFFFLEQESLQLLKGSKLLVGMPWWDYWIPLAARANGLLMKRLKGHRMLHVNHPQTYDVLKALEFSKRFFAAFHHLSQTAATPEYDEYSHFLRSLGAAMTLDLTHDNDHHNHRAFRFGAIAFSLINLMAIDVPVEKRDES